VIVFIAVMVIIFGLLVFMWVSIGREPGPSAADVAIAYERAWDDLDFDLLYDLSGDEMRDGMRKERFVAAKKAAYAANPAPRHLGATVNIDTSIAGHQTALVVTRVDAPDGSIRNNVMLEHRSNGWVVVGYSLRPDAETDSATS
jgi:hypothetical protein